MEVNTQPLDAAAAVNGYQHYNYQREARTAVARRMEVEAQAAAASEENAARAAREEQSFQDLGLFRAILRELQGRRQRRGSTETVPENNNRLHDIALSLRSGRPGYNHCQRV